MQTSCLTATISKTALHLHSRCPPLKANNSMIPRGAFIASAWQVITWFHVLFNRSNKRLVVEQPFTRIHLPSSSCAGSCWEMSLCFGSCLNMSRGVDLLYECPGSVDKVTVNDGYWFTLYLVMLDMGSVWGMACDKQPLWSHQRCLLFLASSLRNEFALTEVS